MLSLRNLWVVTNTSHAFLKVMQMSFGLFVVVQSFSYVRLFATSWTQGFPVLHHLLELAQTHVHWISDPIEPSHPLSSPLLLPSVFPSIRVCSNELVLLIRWSKYWSFSFNISPSNDCLRLISFRMDWLDLLAVQRTLKSLLQHHSSKASILWHSGFFMVQLSHPSMTTEKPVFTTQIFVGKVKCLCFLICCLVWL